MKQVAAVGGDTLDGDIRDPWVVTMFDSIDYDYRKFGKPNQVHALRALAFDAAAGDYLQTHPRASVVALAEGLQTSFWRLDRAGVAGELTWYSIDLPPVMALREQLLPHDDRIVELAQSALDRSWMDRVRAVDGLFITAEGLLMYLEPDDALGLIADCAARFPGGQMMFDSIPHWLTRRTLKGFKMSDRYVAPPMPFALNADEGVALADAIPGVIAARDVSLPPHPAEHHVVGVRLSHHATGDEHDTGHGRSLSYRGKQLVSRQDHQPIGQRVLQRPLPTAGLPVLCPDA